MQTLQRIIIVLISCLGLLCNGDCVPTDPQCEPCFKNGICAPYRTTPAPACVPCCNNQNTTGDICGACDLVCKCHNLCTSHLCATESPPISIPASTMEACHWFAGSTCCDANTSRFVNRFELPAIRGVLDKCTSCYTNWERIACAASCSPVQNTFVRFTSHLEHIGTLYICEDLCKAAYFACEDEDTRPPELVSIKQKYQDSREPWVDFCQGEDFSVDLAAGRITIEVVHPGSNRTCLGTMGLGEEINQKGIPDGKPFSPKQFCDSGEDSTKSLEVSMALALIPFFLGSIISNLLHRAHFVYLPESAVMIILGALLGAIATLVLGDSATRYIAFNKPLFSLLLLPPIIFESGYSLRQAKFMKNLDAILLHAIVGTLIATFVIGGGLWVVRSSFKSLPVPPVFAEWMTFGSLISAVDPVATLATFNSLGVVQNLEVLVFGEALINDAVAIILFKTSAFFLSQVVPPTAGEIATNFFVLTLGSPLLGGAIGILTSLVFKYLPFSSENYIPETVLFVVMTWSTYFIAELAGISGIIASLACGMVCEHYTYRNLTKGGQRQTLHWYKQMACFADLTIFLMIGLVAVVTYRDLSFGLTFFTFFFILLGRIASVFPLNHLVLNVCCRRSPERRIPFNYSCVMWFSGLRGAIAIALAIDLPSPSRHAFTSATVTVAILTVMLFGGGTSPFLKRLNIQVGIPREKKSLTYHSKSAILQMKGWRYFDNRYAKPFLIRSSALEPEGEDENGDIHEVKTEKENFKQGNKYSRVNDFDSLADQDENGRNRAAEKEGEEDDVTEEEKRLVEGNGKTAEVMRVTHGAALVEPLIHTPGGKRGSIGNSEQQRQGNNVQ